MADAQDIELGTESQFRQQWLDGHAETMGRQFLRVVVGFCLLMIAIDLFLTPATVRWLSCIAYGATAAVTVMYMVLAKRRGWNSRGFAVGLQLFAVAGICLFLIYAERLGLTEMRAAVVGSSFLMVIYIMYILTPILTARLHAVLVYDMALTTLYLIMTDGDLYRFGFNLVFMLVAVDIKRQMVRQAISEAGSTYSARHWARQHKLLTLEGDLIVARRVQDSFSMPDHVMTPTGLSIRTYVRKFGAVGGDWVSLWSTPSADYILVVDATGKGIQASLVVHAIQSLWADAQHGDTFDPTSWLERVNKTLLVMGRVEPQSATAAILEIGRSRLRYWSAGHLPLYVVTDVEGEHKMKVVSAIGNPLGIGDVLQLTTRVLDYDRDQTLNLFLGTDGFFDKRPNDSKLFDLIERLPVAQVALLDESEVQDDKTLIWVKVAS